jgi:hypothetical protein
MAALVGQTAPRLPDPLFGLLPEALYPLAAGPALRQAHLPEEPPRAEDDAEDEEDAPEPENILAPEPRAIANPSAPAPRAEYAAPQAGAVYPSAGGYQPPEERGMAPAAGADTDGAAHHQLRVVPAGQERGKAEDGSPSWSLLTISSLMLWADDAARRIGPRRLEMMLELCEISGYIDAKLKGALLRAVDGQAPEPEKARSTSNTSCPACGAPVKDTFDIKCAFCGSPLNSTENDWVVSGLTERGDFRG